MFHAVLREDPKPIIADDSFAEVRRKSAPFYNAVLIAGIQLCERVPIEIRFAIFAGVFCSQIGTQTALDLSDRIRKAKITVCYQHLDEIAALPGSAIIPKTGFVRGETNA